MTRLIKKNLSTKITAELVKKAKNGNEEALMTILELMNEEFFRMAIIKLKNEEDVQDAIQETKIIIYNNIKSLKENKYFKTWAIRILINECNKIYLRKKKDFDNIEHIKERCYEENESFSEEIENKMHVSELLEKLDEEERVIIILFSKGYKIKEIAEILKINENTAKSKIHRIKKKLRTEYKEENFVPHFTKTVITSILIIILTTGLVYASIIIADKLRKEAEPVKWDTSNIKVNSNEEVIKNNMIQYNEETYILQVKNYNKLKEITSALNITYENIDENTFIEHEYEFLIITFLNPKNIAVENILPYDDKITIVFREKKEILETKNAVLLWIPKKYNKDEIEIIYNEEKEENPQVAVKFKFSEFYIGNLEEFYKLNTKYNEEEDYYSLEISDINEYNSIVQKLGLKTYRQVDIEEFKGTKVIFIFRKSNKRLELELFRLKENIPYISLKELDEIYGNGINGTLIVFGTRFENYHIEIK